MSRSFEDFQSLYLNFDSFGFGWSLNADAYYNFGWYGLISIFFICLIIFHYLGNASFKNVSKDFYLYEVCVLLFYVDNIAT